MFPPGSKLGRLVRDPLFLFAVAGVALFATHAFLQARATLPVTLSAETRADLAENFASLAGRRPAADEMARIESDYIADELLFREALDSGLHLANGAIRQQLVEEMRYRITGLLPDPTDEQLVSHYSEHTASYFAEPTVSFAQVYFSSLPDDGGRILEQLQQGKAVQGQAFAHGLDFTEYGQSMLRGIFGQPFVEALWQAPLETWSGPIQSPHGWHYIHPSQRIPGHLLPFGEVREQVENDFMAMVIRRAVDERVAELKLRYEVRIER